MEKEFVPYDLSLRLKKLGFNEPCFGYWSNKYNYSDTILKPQHFISDNVSESASIRKREITCLSPTFSQAFRWFDYSTDWSGFIVPSKEEGCFDWWIQNYVDPNYLSVQSDEYYTEREDAELACLEKLVELVESVAE